MLRMIVAVGIAAVSSLTVASRAEAGRPASARATSIAFAPCAADDLIHAETGAAVTAHVSRAVRLRLDGARLREAARLTLPCGFHIDPRFGWSLTLTDGKQFRQYHENNAFGFAPAFGFGDGPSRPYTLAFEAVAAPTEEQPPCLISAGGRATTLRLCSGFGSATAFFGATDIGRTTRVDHYTQAVEDFMVATIDGRLDALFFLPPPDAAGGTVTVIFTDASGLYRAYLDVPRG